MADETKDTGVLDAKTFQEAVAKVAEILEPFGVPDQLDALAAWEGLPQNRPVREFRMQQQLNMQVVKQQIVQAVREPSGFARARAERDKTKEA